MILLTSIESGIPSLESGMFMSFQMAKSLSQHLKSGELNLSRNLVAVHLPWDGLYKPDLGPSDNLRIDRDTWFEHHLPKPYEGEDLNEKKMIVFPMHGLGDQLYLAVALRNLFRKYPDMRIDIVKSSISSAEQWYPHIYHEKFYNMAGPVITAGNMGHYDYYLNAEHFAHIDDYKGTYPPYFYLKYFFRNKHDASDNMRPVIGAFSPGSCPNSRQIADKVRQLKNNGKPLIFLNSVSTGRVRDFPLATVLEFLERIHGRYSVLVSSFKRPDIQSAVNALNFNGIEDTTGLITHVTDLMEIIRLSDGVITTDSGITHLSEALETPCGSVFNVVTPDERIAPYKYCESLDITFQLEGVCKTPCYIHALEKGDLCPGMKEANRIVNMDAFYDYPPCLENLSGDHLCQLLEALSDLYSLRV